ncbi:MAG TPA: phospholipase D-like domain-containing protein [Actinomycetota bacterium]|nr:phospholipase D-like domain-containing protein [Actinomycetota bacterium]
MRVRKKRQGLTLQAVAGTNVVLLGFDMGPDDCEGLLGFAVHRTSHKENRAAWIEGLKTFQATDPGFPPGSKYSTRDHPIQGFTWSDLTARPGQDYTYRVVALKGSPADLRETSDVSVRVQTESPEGGTHDVYFNRGAGASQEYARRFGNRRPDKVGKPAFDWLSRGLYEAIEGFVAQATGQGFALRVCAYEFHYEPFLKALDGARRRGVDVRVVYDHRKKTPGTKNAAAVKAAGIEDLCIPRESNASELSHNKFVVLLQEGRPIAVLTGGTNFTAGGIFGHSNGVHIVQEEATAAAYNRYWELLSTDPASRDVKKALVAEFPVPDGLPPAGTTPIFSPRDSLQALDWYVSLAKGAKEGLFATFAFGMHEGFQEVYRTSTARMRYALLEKVVRPMKAGPAREAAEKAIARLRFQPENRFAVGAHLQLNSFDRWLEERLSGLNHAVQYLHTKYMLIDPLGPDPIVVTGSANFSAASTTDNDENMLVIRGNKRVAEIYLGEFMRMYNHFAFREWAASKKAKTSQTSPSHLRTDDWWREYFGDTERSHQRAYFVS